MLGIALNAPMAQVAVAICRSGVDFMCIDRAQAVYAAKALDAIPTLMRQHGVVPMIRVAWNAPALIKPQR